MTTSTLTRRSLSDRSTGGLPSAALVLCVLSLSILQAAHLAFRPRGWTVDSIRTVNSYLFSLILFGPVCAGLAAWAGSKFRVIGWLVRERPLRALRSFFLPIIGIALGTFITWLLFALGLAALRNAPIVLEDGRAIDLLVALVGIVAYAAVGFWAGTRWPFPVLPAAVVVVSFAVTMTAWIGGRANLVQFGHGPTDGRGFSAEAQTIRFIFWAAVAGMGLTGAVRSSSALGKRSRALHRAVVGVMFATLIWAFVSRADYADYPQKLVCAGKIRFCVAERAGRYLDAIVMAQDEPVVRSTMAFLRSVPSVREPAEFRVPFPYYYPDPAASMGSAIGRSEIAQDVALTLVTESLPPYCSSEFASFDGPPRVYLSFLVYQDWLNAALGRISRTDYEERRSHERSLIEEGLSPAPLNLPAPRPSFTSPEAQRWVAESASLFPQCD